MNVVVVGNGGRENAIIKSLNKSQNNLNIYGLGDNLNPDIIPMLKGFRLLEKYDMDEAVSFIRKINPRFVVIGPEKYLENGLTDILRREGIPTIGPSSLLSKIETSKSFCRNFLKENNLDNLSPKFFQIFRETTKDEIDVIFKTLNNHLVLKPDGLTGGKGVKIFNNQNSEALEYIEEVLENDTFMLVEKYLVGEEFIQLSFCDGKNIVHCPVIKDFKKISKDDNTNTGSMGCIIQKNQIYKNVSKNNILEGQNYNKKVMDMLSNIDNYGFRGVLYGSYISTKDGIKLIEYNSRLGDPEGIMVLTALESSLFYIFDSITNQTLDKININFKNTYGLCKYIVPDGYPNNSRKDLHVDISGLTPDERDCIYLSGIISKNCKLVTTGSRAIAVCKMGQNIDRLNQDVEDIIDKIKGELYHRDDICNEIPKSIYKESGVNIEEGNLVVQKIMDSLESTHDENVESVRGDFGGLYNIGKFFSKNEYNEPIMVSSTDGVGTKTIFVLDNMDKEEGMIVLGQDIVNHCINDILVKGAIPIMFLDYFASSCINSDLVKNFVDGVSMACRLSNCNLMGGETAEMPGVYQDGKIDIVGTILGVVEKNKIINGKKNIKLGNMIYGLKSSGPHTNGYSLIRNIYSDNLDIEVYPELLKPHKSYLSEIRQLWGEGITINGLCHITGGGFYDNLPRVLPDGYGVNLYIKIPEIYKKIGELGFIKDRELLTVFNCGYGMLIFVDENVIMPEGFDYLGDVCEGDIKINC